MGEKLSTGRARHLRTVAAVMVLSLLTAACGGGDNGDSADDDKTGVTTQDSAAPRNKRGGTLRRASSEPDAIDPNRITDTAGVAIVRLLYVGLVSHDKDMAIVPGVAERWDKSTDGLTYTFHLRDDAKFSDGTPVTAADFVFSAKRFLDPDFAAPNKFQSPIKGWNAAMTASPSGVIGDVEIPGMNPIDEHTLEVKLDSPYVFLLDDLTGLAPVPAGSVDTEAEAAAFGDLPLGNGPYKMAEPWRHNTSITLERNPEYFGDGGNPDRIETLIFADTLAPYRELQAGNIDIASPPVSQIGQARKEFGKRFLQSPAAFLYFVGLPVNSAPWSSVELRQAFALATDREVLSERLLDGIAVAAEGFVPPTFRGASKEACPNLEHDPARARKLYEKSGGIPGNAATAYYPTGQGIDDLAQAIANDIRQNLGVDLTFKQIELGQYLQKLGAGIDGPYGFALSAANAYDFVSVFETGSSFNFGGYSNPAFDALMKQVRESATIEDADKLLGDAQEILCDEMPVLPLAFPGQVFVHSDRIENLLVNSSGDPLLEQVIVRS